MRIDDHFFRHESGRILTALTRIFGIHNLAMAEDVVQDAFCRALDVWKMSGIPQNPSAWLMMTAKNRALDLLRRERTARTFAPELGRLLESEWTVAPVVEELFAENAIKDDLLRMMFSCCNPLVVAWNTMKMQLVLDRCSTRPSTAVPPELIGRIAPTCTEGNLSGVFSFPIEPYAEQLLPSLAATNHGLSVPE